jgi:hypothetical protein
MNRLLLITLFSFALAIAGMAQLDDCTHFKPVDEATNESVRKFFKQFEQLYNFHQAHILASYFAETGVWKTPQGNYTGSDAIEKRMDSFDFGHWHARNEVITVNDVRSLLGTVLLGVVGNWTNTVQEEGGQPIALQGWWNAMIFPDDENDSWSIQINTYGIDK